MKARKLLAAMGCSDGSCLLHPKTGGQHTNGGCHCVPFRPSTSEVLTVRQAIRLYQQLVEELEAEVERLKAP